MPRPTNSSCARHAAGLLFIVACCTAVSAAADETSVAWQVKTIAGNGLPGDLNHSDATQTPLDQPFGVERGPDGALYITSIGQHRVLRLDTQLGQLSSVAGSGQSGYAGDGGAASKALLNEPYEVRFSLDGRTMYFVEMKNHLIRQVDLANGTIATLAGDPRGGFAGDDGPASAARFQQPHSIALDDRGQLYVADIGNHRIRCIDTTTGTITSIAGNGERKLPRDGALAQGNPMIGPRALHVVGRTLWIALREGHSIWRLDLDSNRFAHVAGTGKAGYSGDGGSPRDATFNGPKGIVATPEGIVYVVDTENQVIRRIDTGADRIDTIAGGGPKARGFNENASPPYDAQFVRPHGIGLLPDGSLAIGDTNNHRVRWLRPPSPGAAR